MSKSNLIEQAVRTKARFNFNNGVLSVEDLYDLSYLKLNEMYKSYKSEQITSIDNGLLDETSEEDKALTLKIDVIAYVFERKLEDAKEAEKAKIAANQLHNVLSIIADKQNESLRNMSLEELIKLKSELGSK